MSLSLALIKQVLGAAGAKTAVVVSSIVVMQIAIVVSIQVQSGGPQASEAFPVDAGLTIGPVRDAIEPATPAIPVNKGVIPSVTSTPEPAASAAVTPPLVDSGSPSTAEADTSLSGEAAAPQPGLIETAGAEGSSLDFKVPQQSAARTPYLPD